MCVFVFCVCVCVCVCAAERRPRPCARQSTEDLKRKHRPPPPKARTAKDRPPKPTPNPQREASMRAYPPVRPSTDAYRKHFRSFLELLQLLGIRINLFADLRVVGPVHRLARGWAIYSDK